MTPEQLVEIEAIKALKYRYVRAVDLKLWDELAGTMTVDVHASYGDGQHTFDGRDELVAWLQESLGSLDRLSSHRVGQPELSFEGADRVVGTWALNDVVLLLDLGLTVRGSAFYRDRYVKVDGRWLIAETAYSRVYEEMEERPDGLKLTGRWGGGSWPPGDAQ